MISRITEHGNDEQVHIKTYPAGTFKKSGTNVITCVISLRKNDVSDYKIKKPVYSQSKLF